MNNHTSSLESPHFPVMLNEVLHISSPSNGGRYIDCTFGGGGYCKEILKYPKTNVQALDRDKKALLAANKLEKRFPNRFKFNQIKFSQLDTISCNNLDVAIFDLGLSSIQLDDLERGFSFKSRKKLNMTMGLNEISALDVINNLSEIELKLVIKILGEEKEASKIAKNIVKHRNTKKITNTADLARIIEKSKKKNFSSKINPCTKTFQALRIFVNKEISELIYGLINSFKLLPVGGIIVVVTFHSIEDKIVKYFFKNYSEIKNNSRYYPESKNKTKLLFKLANNKPIYPNQSEIKKNPPSRSAKLRYGIKIRESNDFNDFISKFENLLKIENLSNEL